MIEYLQFRNAKSSLGLKGIVQADGTRNRVQRYKSLDKENQHPSKNTSFDFSYLDRIFEPNEYLNKKCFPEFLKALNQNTARFEKAVR